MPRPLNRCMQLISRGLSSDSRGSFLRNAAEIVLVGISMA